jgi:periplasmic divalent cation tolerance protein
VSGPADGANVPEAGQNGAVRVVFMTAPAQDVAEDVVRTLVGERLAACGNIVPGITSIYRWKGEVQRDSEVLVILKTGAATLDAMIRRAAELHPYEVPELLAVDVARGFEPYVQWVGHSCG